MNLEETARVAQAVKIPVVASGGVASLDDIRALKGIEKYGVEAVIVGRALYSGAFTLRQAIGLAAGDLNLCKLIFIGDLASLAAKAEVCRTRPPQGT